MVALLLALALPALASSQWHPAIGSALPEVRGPAAGAAARLAAFDLSSERGQRLLTPLIPHLVAQGLGEETLAALPLPRRVAAVTKALEALGAECEGRARAIVAGAETASGDRLAEDAESASSLLRYAAPYLEEARRKELARVEPALKARAAEQRRAGILARAQERAESLGSRR